MPRLRVVRSEGACEACRAPSGQNHEDWCLNNMFDMLRDTPLRRQMIIYRESHLHAAEDQPYRGGVRCKCGKTFGNHSMHQAQMIELAIQAEEERDQGAGQNCPTER